MKRGFTLAEVLITLGIIGVVAAITIPNLIANNQKRVATTRLQKAISVLNQAYKLSFDDVGEVGIEEAKDLNSQEYFDKYWAPYLKTISYCSDNPTTCGYKSAQPFKDAKNGTNTWYVSEPRLKTSFMTPDGFVYVISLATWADVDNLIKKPSSYVLVDINAGSGPNKYGRDVFFLSRVPENGGGIRTYCYDKDDDYINNECSKTGKGECCAEKIRRAGWQIRKDYPW